MNTAFSGPPEPRSHALRTLTTGPVFYAPDTRWPALAALPAAVFIFLAASLLALIPAEYYARSAGFSVFEGRTTQAGGGGEHLRTLDLVLLGTTQFAIVVLVWFAAGFFRSSRIDTLALRPPAQGARVYALSLFLVLLATGLFSLVIFAVDPTLMLRDLRPFSALMQSDARWLALLVVGIGAPISEELLFRGFLFSALAKSRLGLVGTSLLTTALWTGLHANYAATAIIEVFGIGLLLSWLLVRTGSLRVPIFCHGAYNTILMVLLAFNPLPPA